MVLYPKRLILAIMVIITVASSFWLGSRYPALNEKAMMANSASVADTIAAFPILEVKDEYPIWKKVAYSSVNWANDNKKGMTFGVIIGGLFLTLISYLQFRQQGNRMMKTFYGFLLGTPLGVCVNCAAPVFKGVLQSRQAELAFAMMLSSPTMNIVVLTMVFTLFPFYMAVTKTVFVLLVIFAGVPLISRFLGDDHELKDLIKVEKDDVDLGQNCEIKHHESFFSALKGFARDAVKNIWFIIARTVPLMFLAGFLGSLVSHVIPLDLLMGEDGVLTILTVAFVGLFLPVPVAFDVILVNALFTAGMAPGLSLILLCTLGIYSSYSFMITWQSASKQWALGLSSMILVLSVSLGFLGDQMHHLFYLKGNIEQYQALRNKMQPSQSSDPRSEAPIFQMSAAAPWRNFMSSEQMDVKYRPFLNKKDAVGTFVRHEGPKFGLDEGFTYGIRDYPDPFWIGRGTASGDFDQDGWLDIAFGSDKGIKLYKNIGGRFVPGERLLFSESMRVYSVAFLDWNNDGWLDLFFTSFNKGNYVYFNRKGIFDQEAYPVPNGKGILTVSPSFGDIDQDGYPDVYNANMALGIVTGFAHYGPGRRNSVTFNRALDYHVQDLDEFDGESMASLVSDFNDDGFLDIYVSNDFTIPDYLYYGGKNGGLKLEESEESVKRGAPIFSMSIDTADFNNDGKWDYIASGTLETSRALMVKPVIDGQPYATYSQLKGDASWCAKIEQDTYRENCMSDRGINKTINLSRIPNLSVSSCTKIKNANQRDDCLLAVMWLIVTNNKSTDDCSRDFGFDPIIEEVCFLHKRKKGNFKKEEIKGYIRQGNMPFLYLANDKGYVKAPFDHPGGWTWSMKAADLDNDGWVDIFNGEGAVRRGQFGFNVAMRNLNGKGFEQKQFSWGLAGDFGVFSFSFIDFDNDGDLDVIANSAVAPIRVFENKLNDNERVAFSIRSEQGNRLGLHTKVTITDDQGRQQMREIKAGGGYQSFDAPVAYFGLGQGAAIKSVVIKPLGQEPILLEQKFPAGAHYQINLK